MSSLRSLQQRRRSQSASNSFPSIHRESSWRSATKRAHPATTDFSSFKKDVDSWRSKRRRREGSHSGTSSDDEPAFSSKSSTRSSPKPVLASSSVDFGFAPRRDSRQRHSMYNSTSIFEPSSHSEYSELARVRSNAFWELRRSVAENGEGFVRRMRDYEQSRSRADAFSKVKDAQKRGRKRSSLVSASRKTPTRHHNDSESDEDDIQLFSGHLSESFLSRTTHSTSSRSPRPSSPDFMEEDPIPRERCPSPYDFSSDPLSVYPTSPAGSSLSPARPLNTTPSLSLSPSSAGSSIVSLTLPPSTTSQNLTDLSFSQRASRSEKALAALSLAMANGAGSITEDYEALRALQPLLAMDGSEVEDVWH
ncbi:hypothetical protein GYMLUDRAFT_235512 [Collybiopsis luxurians FD-317 M1]|nr:hypothetical protein GYMLUDRAFT_235512 [Collybiopsis luxurians FD-317 M1]